MNPYTADQSFLFAYVEPVPNPREGVIDEALECTVEDLLAGKAIMSSKYPVVVQALGRPCMRWAYCGMCNEPDLIRMASNCLRTVLDAVPGSDGVNRSSNWERFEQSDIPACLRVSLGQVWSLLEPEAK